MVFSKFRRNPTGHARLKDDERDGSFSFFPERKHEDKRPMLKNSSEEERGEEERDEKWIAAFQKSEHNRAILDEDNIDVPETPGASAVDVMAAAMQFSPPSGEAAVVTPRAAGSSSSYLPANITPKAAGSQTKPDPFVRQTSTSTSASAATLMASNTLDHKDAQIASLKEKCERLRKQVLEYGDVDQYTEKEDTMKLEQEKFELKKVLQVVKSQLKFTKDALEDATQRLQTQSNEAAKLKETIDNQTDQIDSLETKAMVMETDKMELTEKFAKEKAELAETIDKQEDQLHDLKLNCELLEKELRELKLELKKEATSEDDDDEVVAKASPEKQPSSESESDESVFKGIDEEGESNPNPFGDNDNDDESVSSSYRNPFGDEQSAQEEDVESRNPFEETDDDLVKMSSLKKQQSKNPFDSERRERKIVEEPVNPFDDGGSDHIEENPEAERFAEREAELQKQLADLQAKYAEKVGSQLSQIASLQEENDMKDIQLQQLREEKEKSQKTNRRSFFRRKDELGDSNVDLTAQSMHDYVPGFS